MFSRIHAAVVIACLTVTPQAANAQVDSSRQIALSIKLCEQVSGTSKRKVLADPTIIATVGKSFSMVSGGTVKPKVGEGRLEFGTQVTGELNTSDNGMIQAALKISLGTHKQSDSTTDIVVSESIEIRTVLRPEETKRLDYTADKWCEVSVDEVNSELQRQPNVGSASEKSSSKTLAGEWRFVAMVEKGHEASSDELREMKWHIRGNRIRAMQPDYLGSMLFKLDESSVPMALDIVPIDENDRAKGETELGICTLQEERLQICLRNSEVVAQGRPKTFTDQDGCWMMVLERIRR